MTDVSAHHALSVEIGTNLADGLLHHENPAIPVVDVEGQGDLPKLVVELIDMCPSIGRILALADRPTRYALDVSLGPPAVQYAHVQDSVEGSFHAAGS